MRGTVFAMKSLRIPFMQLMVKIFKGFLALALTLLLACMIYVHFCKADLSNRVLHAIRSELATDLQISRFEVDLLSAFPRVQFELHEVLLNGKGESTLLRADELQLTVSLFNLFSDHIRFRRLSLKDGELQIVRLADGTLSLDILKDNGSSGSGGPALHFHKIELNNIGIQYHDKAAKQEYSVLFNEGTVTASYGNQNLHFEIDCDVKYEYVRIDKSTYLNGVTGSIEGNVNLDLNDDLYSFEELVLQIGKQRYDINGSVRGEEDAQHIDIAIDQRSGELSSFIEILPAEYRKDLPFSNASGKFTAQGKIEGRMNSKENPYIAFDIQVEAAEMESLHRKGTIRNIHFNGSFDNGTSRRLSSSTLDLPVINGKAYGQKFEASLKLTDLNDPTLECTFDGSLPAEFVLDYMGDEKSSSEISGAVHFSDVAIGPVRLDGADFTDIKQCRGRCTLGNVVIKTPNGTYKIPDGILTLAEDTLKIAALQLQLDKDEASVNGWIAELGDALEGNDPAYLRYDLSLNSKSLNLTKWIPELSYHRPTERQAQIKPVSNKTYAPLRLPQGTMTMSSDQFQFNDITAKALTGTWNTTTHQLLFEAKAEAADGMMQVNGTLETSTGYLLKLQIRGDGINVRNCFEQCRNFGQQSIRAEHIRGTSDVKVLADIAWGLDGNLLDDQIHVYAGMSIRDGELLGFDMLEQFSKYVHAEDLRHIRFSRIDNYIEVRNGNVYIPAMFIRSNAVNMVVNGIHRLDNHILYNIKVNAGQIMTTKMKKHNPRLSPLPANKAETFNLFFTIAGTMDEFSYEMNKRSAESSFAQSEELRDRIREQLRIAFGETLELIEPPEWETIPEYHKEQVGEDFFLEID